MLAHIAGVPLEEWMLPLLASGTGILVGLRVAVRRSLRSAPASRVDR